MGNCNSYDKITLLSGRLKQMKLLTDRGDYTIYEHIQEEKQYEYWVWKSEQDTFEEAELTAQDFQSCESITKICYHSRGYISETFTKQYIFAMLMEHPSYNLWEYLNRQKILSQNQIINIVVNIIEAQRILRDSYQYLGFQNIYTKDGNHWMLKPFQQKKSFVTNNKQFEGYPAPEEFINTKFDVERATIFGFGMLLLHLILNKSNQDLYKASRIDENALSIRIQELLQKKNYDQEFLKIIVQMLNIDPNYRPDYTKLVILLAIKNIGLSSQQQNKLSQVLNQSQSSKKSGILNGLVSVPLEKEKYIIKLLNSQQQIQKIDEEIEESMNSANKQVDEVINAYSVIYYNNHQILNEAFDYNDFTNVMNYATRYEGQVKNKKKHGPGTLYLSNNEYFQGNFVNDLIEGQGQFYTLNKSTIRGVWKAHRLQERLSISRFKPLFQQHQQMSDKCNVRTQVQSVVDDVAEEICYSNVAPIFDASTQFHYDNKQYKSQSSDQITFHSTVDLNNRRQGYISNEEGMVIYAGLFCGDLYDGYGVLKNLNHEQIDLVDHMDLNVAGKAWVKYDGQFKMGKKNGNGTLHFSDKSIFQGKFQDDQISGMGQFINSKNEVINGRWINGLYQQESK
ncbi:unnamed protein product (macronuclear) [Paramecium tetraurelia]|uniref:Protein kinase domain-containing protein n=1 Tax=Paramecium tetraurelia TaxID=5888 RepID=A0C8K7_PARTE|nr:uncharacterized protein GSPATT00036258001 [Paramecium tetraurelia]CAK67124.1 unnamed protein product [Paramecium tetraurelia]|eukprot:XP_001434521.1 hypothetical protein (macronuclear) [Paramecium tetraurelia strain d4-2]